MNRWMTDRQYRGIKKQLQQELRRNLDALDVVFKLMNGCTESPSENPTDRKIGRPEIPFAKQSEITSMLSEGRYSSREIADKVGVNRNTVNKIKKRIRQRFKDAQNVSVC